MLNRVRVRWCLLVGVTSLLSGCLYERIDNPARSHGFPTASCADADALAIKLSDHVHHLADKIGPRSYLAPNGLKAARDYIKQELEDVRGGQVEVSSYKMTDLCEATLTNMRRRADARKCRADWDRVIRDIERQTFENIELSIPGTGHTGKAVVVGAHYDTDACESGGYNPGADDNATGVAALIELAKLVAARHPERSVRFVAYTNEEEPFFWTDGMGSRQFLLKHRDPKQISAMLSIETIGYYHDEQQTPDVPWYGRGFDIPDTADFIAFVGNRCSRQLVRDSECYFQEGVAFPAEGISAWGRIPGIGWSDHWSFWQEDIPAVMATDTAPFRNHCYHRRCDKAERLDFERMARVVLGLENVIVSLARDSPPRCDLQDTTTPRTPLWCGAAAVDRAEMTTAETPR